MKSGIEMLEEILHKVDVLTKKIDVLEQNLKRVANSAKAVEIAEKGKKSTSNMRFGISTANSETVDVPLKKQIDAPVAKVPQKKFTGPMVSGRIIINGEKPTAAIGLDVKIYDSNNKLVKATKTNGSGVWMSKLDAGQKYAVEITGKFKGQDLVPINKIINVPFGVEEYEVA